MKASALEFRLRYLVHGVIYALGFTAPWNYLLSTGAGDPGFWSGKAIWLPAALAIERAGWMSLTGASNLLLGLGIFFALAGAALRTWGAAYIGSAVVKDGGMHDASVQTRVSSDQVVALGDRGLGVGEQVFLENNQVAAVGTQVPTAGKKPFVGVVEALAGGIVADGPYRYMRNPLYLGTMLHTLAVTLLMPLSGAVFVVVAIAVEQMRLIGGEEAFLEGKLGERYLQYKRLVPRILPALRARVAASAGSAVRPAWGMAVLGEIYFWGVAVAFASVGTRYNALLVIQGVVIALGASLVARAFVPKVEVA